MIFVFIILLKIRFSYLKAFIFGAYFLVKLNPVGLNFVGRNLVGRNLVGRNCVGRNFVGRNLVGRNLVGRNLVGRNLVGRGRSREGLMLHRPKFTVQFLLS